MGPSHPAMHGTVRMVLEVEGERISSADIQIGYLHRCFEKEAENATWTQIFPYTDRLNYISPMLNNVGYALAVEKLLGIEKKIPERAQFIRVIVGEVSRICDHLTCLGASAMELGAFTVFLYALKAREWLFELLEEVCGARLTSTYCRIGGVAYDLPDGFDAKLRDILARTRIVMSDIGKLLERNRIFRDRMDGIGIITQADALALRHHRPGGTLDRPRLRRPQGPPVPGLRPLRLRRAGRLGRRQLRPLRRSRRGDRAVDAHPRPGAGADPAPARCCCRTRASRCRPRARPTTRSRR